MGGLCRALCLHQTPPQGSLLKERSGTDPIMKAHHGADQIRGQCGTPTFQIKVPATCSARTFTLRARGPLTAQPVTASSS